ncbi:MAG: diadenylate cyclase CdaA [Eubacteriales bacterium]
MEALKSFITDSWNGLAMTIASMRILDVVDVLVVSVLLYYIIKFIRDRRAGKLAAGVVFLIVVQLLSDLLDLVTMKFIMQNVFQLGLLAVIVVFQPELRSLLENVGGDSIRSLKIIGEQRDNDGTSAVISAVCEAARDMSLTKTGALIVFERSTKLGDVIKSGTVVNADPSVMLIKNIFFNKASLHDGAMIIRGGRVYAAGCFLPVSVKLDISKDLGTRHRAAIGMSENSDALVVVVSEETGTISIALGGQLRRGFDDISLRAELSKYLIKETRGQTRTRIIRHNTKKDDK